VTSRASGPFPQRQVRKKKALKCRPGGSDTEEGFRMERCGWTRNGKSLSFL